MHEVSTDDERPSKMRNGDAVTVETAALESSTVKFDIGSFVLCHRKLSRLVHPLIRCYESFLYIIRWQSPGLTLVVMLFSVYLSIRHPAYLAVIPMVYSSIVFSLSGVRKLGSKITRESLIMRKRNVQRKVEDTNSELKIAAIKQAREDLKDYISFSIQIHAIEAALCMHLEKFYRICRWDEETPSKICLFVLLLVTLSLVLFPGQYLMTVGIMVIFTGNSEFQKVRRRVLTQCQVMLQQLRGYIFKHKIWLYLLNIIGVRGFFKTRRGLSLTSDNGDEWYDAEQEMLLTSESESFEDENGIDDNEDSEDEDTPTTRRRARLFSGLSVVTHFADYRKKQKRINSGNCASCDVSFSSVLKKRQYCRHCGDSFCSRCCSQRVKRAVFGATAPAAYEETVLVCKSCYSFLMNKTYGQNTDIW